MIYEKLYLTVKQAAVYANVSEAKIREWINQSKILNATKTKEYYTLVDADELDILISFKETFSKRVWVNEFKKAKRMGLVFDKSIPTYYKKHFRYRNFLFKTMYKEYQLKSNIDTRVFAIYINKRFRIVDGDYAKSSNKNGGYIIYFQNKLRCSSEQKFLELFEIKESK